MEGHESAQEKLASLTDLPVEVRLFRVSVLPQADVLQLLYKIHLLSCSPALPYTCRSIYHVFASTSTEYRVGFLWSACLTCVGGKIATSLVMEKAVCFPLCTLSVYKLLREELFDQMELEMLRQLSAMGARQHALLREDDPTLPEYLPEQYTLADVKQLPQGRERGQFDLDGPTFLSCALSFPLPKRLFSHLTSGPDPVEPNLHLIAAMLEDDARIPDSRGYALERAVKIRHIPLLQLLLSNYNSSLFGLISATKVAIHRDDIEVVKLFLDALTEDGSSIMHVSRYKWKKKDWHSLWGSASKKSQEMVKVFEIAKVCL